MPCQRHQLVTPYCEDRDQRAFNTCLPSNRKESRRVYVFGRPSPYRRPITSPLVRKRIPAGSQRISISCLIVDGRRLKPSAVAGHTHRFDARNAPPTTFEHVDDERRHRVAPTPYRPRPHGRYIALAGTPESRVEMLQHTQYSRDERQDGLASSLPAEHIAPDLNTDMPNRASPSVQVPDPAFPGELLITG
jgi:hypothetical protein